MLFGALSMVLWHNASAHDPTMDRACVPQDEITRVRKQQLWFHS
eukprot:CAMPEP_0172766366 /NCGR_PEP_ID=MMETSP1074-20121228/181078_1 /TAXON_ID=2916 /ORGANISM="Ceratium fusus, Strain PA161109" /LENGTH=43 /DNA_ID= /DNA_START= /DNA_END= /DNA_ORIENTATION=